MCACALVGGFLTANVGSGSDMALYGFGIFGWNALHPELAMSETQLTASSVCVMALHSVYTSLARALTYGIGRDTLLCWGADVWIVVLGAPLGTLVLTPSSTVFLRRVFYALALLQFVNLGMVTKQHNAYNQKVYEREKRKLAQQQSLRKRRQERRERGVVVVFR